MTEQQSWTIMIAVFSILAGVGGYLLGLNAKSGPVVVQPNQGINNYDPARQIANDAMEQLQKSNASCWSNVQRLVIENGELRRAKETSH